MAMAWEPCVGFTCRVAYIMCRSPGLLFQIMLQARWEKSGRNCAAYMYRRVASGNGRTKISCDLRNWEVGMK